MTTMIDILDLKNPELTPAQAMVAAQFANMPIDLSVDAILKTAKERTGLNDFGDFEFLPRLESLVNEWNQDDGLTGMTRFTLFNKLATNASNYLLITDTLKKHPEIHDEVIEKPIVVGGLPRSGTTHLVNLLAADDRLRSLPLWLTYEPIPLPSEVAQGIDGRFERCDQQWQGMQMVVPLLASMHPMNPEHIHEDCELMASNFASYVYEWYAHSPKWRDNYLAQDQTPHYQFMKTVLKILQWQKPGGRWLFKCPQHMEQLPALHQVFPDASILITHRDPVSVIQSSVTMLAYGQRTGRKQVDTEGLIQYWSDRIKRLLQSFVRDRAQLNDIKIMDVRFHEFMAQDYATIEKVYQFVGLPMTETSKQNIQQYIADHPRGKDGQIVYQLKRDFGVDPDILRQEFDFYTKPYAVKLETK